MWRLALQLLAIELALGCAAVVVGLLIEWIGLGRVAARVRSGRLGQRPGFHRFRMIRAQVGALTLLAMVALVVSLIGPQDSLPGALQFGTAAVSVLGTLALYTLATAWLVTPRAWTSIRGGPFNTRAYVGYITRLLPLSYLPWLVLAEIGAALYLADLEPLRWAIPLLAGLWVGLAAIWSPQIRTWLTGAKPLAETPWAELAPRIRAWAKLAGIDVHDLRVDTTDGNTDNAVMVGLRERTLFLGAELLANTDWRQLDAVVGHELGHLRFRHLPVNAWMGILRTVLFVALLMAALDPNVLAFVFPQQTAGAPQDATPGAIIAATLSPLVALGLATAVVVISAVDRGRRHRAELACDRFSGALTGDPLAMVVALHTIIGLIGYPLTQRSATHPTFAQRQQALMYQLYQPGPRADWAYAPVPAAIPYVVPPYSYTMPLDQAPPPAPVEAPPERMVSYSPPLPAPPAPYPNYAPALPLWTAPQPYQPAGIYPPVPPYVPPNVPAWPYSAPSPPPYPGPMPAWAPPPYPYGQAPYPGAALPPFAPPGYGPQAYAPPYVPAPAPYYPPYPPYLPWPPAPPYPPSPGPAYAPPPMPTPLSPANPEAPQ